MSSKSARRAAAADAQPASLASPSDTILGGAEFCTALDRLGPFERQPHLAVAVSGGRDSLALAVLAHEWATARAGRITALIVDHRLRDESQEEARSVLATLGQLGIAASLSTWAGDKPATGLAEAAREARYALLQDWCARHGVLHLLLAHQQDDQGETVLMRLADGSGAAGLAGMAPIVERGNVRLLRPLLGVARNRLTATLQARALPWIDDPTNGNLRYLRPRLRREASQPLLQTAAALADRFGQDRAAIEKRLACLLADLVSVMPEGWLTIDRAALLSLPEQLAAQVLSATLSTIGGRGHAPRRRAVAGALAAIAAGRSTTAGGCRVTMRRDVLVIAREAGAIEHVIDLAGGQAGALRWDDRFELELGPGACGRLAALGEAGRRAVLAESRFAGSVHDFVSRLPAMVARALPALWTSASGPEAPVLQAVGGGGRLDGAPATVTLPGGSWLTAAFRPRRPLAPAPHALVLAGQRLI